MTVAYRGKHVFQCTVVRDVGVQEMHARVSPCEFFTAGGVYIDDNYGCTLRAQRHDHALPYQCCPTGHQGHPTINSRH